MQRAEQQLNDAMSSPIVLAAAQMGFNNQEIRHVLRRQVYTFLRNFKIDSSNWHGENAFHNIQTLYKFNKIGFTVNKKHSE